LRRGSGIWLFRQLQVALLGPCCIQYSYFGSVTCLFFVYTPVYLFFHVKFFVRPHVPANLFDRAQFPVHLSVLMPLSLYLSNFFSYPFNCLPMFLPIYFSMFIPLSPCHCHTLSTCLSMLIAHVPVHVLYICISVFHISFY
jgi:hypothetical protein